MSDIRTIMIDHTPEQLPAFDWLIDQPALADENGLTTAIIISLFTDRLANADDELPGDDDRRGWWADAFANVDGDLIGSRLWLLNREKELQSVVNRARDYATESLQWLIDDGIASRVDVVAGWIDKTSLTISEVKTNNSITGALGLAVVVYRNKEAPVKFQFNEFWRLN